MTIQEKQKVAKQKLDECSSARKQLAADLGAAAAKRGKAEKALAMCAAERAKLTEELRQCAEVDRPAAEKALAKWAKERSMLEAELKQCAEVDRPNAEKALAQCGKDRAMLEAKLAKVVKALKEKAGGGPLPATKPKSTRRRRRAKKAKKAALSQVEAEDPSDALDNQDDMSSATVEAAVSASALIQYRRKDSLRMEDVSLLSETSHSTYSSMSAARLRVERHRLRWDIESLKKKARALMAKWTGVNKRIARANKKLGESDAEEANVMKKMNATQAKEQAKQKLLEAAEARAANLVSQMNAEDSKLEIARKKLEGAMSAEGKASADLAKEQGAETAALLQLASLVQEEHDALHANVEESHSNVTARLRSNEEAIDALAVKGKEADCDAMRADVVKAKAKLELTGVALMACLKAKKEIQAKIDQAVMLGKKAEAGLATCLKNKAMLKTKIKMCHERRDEARAKLEACLKRKKELKEKIAAAGGKTPQKRRLLLQEERRRRELKEKIAAAGGKTPQKRSSLMQEAADLETEAAEALDEMHKGNLELQSALEELTAASQ